MIPNTCPFCKRPTEHIECSKREMQVFVCFYCKHRLSGENHETRFIDEIFVHIEQKGYMVDVLLKEHFIVFDISKMVGAIKMGYMWSIPKGDIRYFSGDPISLYKQIADKQIAMIERSLEQ